MHKPVLLKEVIESLDLKDGDIVIDGTLGLGGHTKAICESGKSIKVIALDLDSEAIEIAKQNLKDSPCDITFMKSNYKNLDEALDSLGLMSVDKILLDLGLSSYQLDYSKRGFSFQKDEPLDMAFDPEKKSLFNAYDIVNSWDEENIAQILWSYADEKFSRRIAKNIVEKRKTSPIKTTRELKELVFDSVPFWARRSKTHPATKTFQALRIATNNEIENIKEFLPKAYDHLSSHGRMAIISFHSLEDRIIKNYFREKQKEGGVIITKKPIVPTENEVGENPRSRSAKLRVLQKNGI